LSVYWSRLAAGLEPYVPGEQPKDMKYIKLNTNENPFGPSPEVIKAVKGATDDSLRLYPDSDCSDLVEAAARYYGVEKEQVFAGNGSDEVLAFAFMAFFDPGREILFPDVTYSFYPVYTSLFGLNYRTVPLNEEFDIPEEGFFKSKGGVVIANPNAPTGKAVSLEKVERILDENSNTVVIIDEAYIDFGGETAVPLIDRYPNLLVVQTLSKSRSLAGMRVGFAIGSSVLIDGLKRVKNSFNSYTLDRLAIKAGIAALKDSGYFKETRNKIIRTRERVAVEMRARGFYVTDSKANFIFASHPRKKAAAIFYELRQRGILVRYFDKERIDNFLRITIGSDEDMNVFLNALKDILAESDTKPD
jgi:histidinol-phosphate aminotransferase